jgi:hypothetical protein
VNRVLEYGFILICMTPFLLMIFAPNIIEPFFQYFAKWDRKVLNTIALNLSFVMLYFQVKGIIIANRMIYVKFYLLFSSLVSLVAYFTSITFLIIKVLFYVGFFSIYLYAFWHIYQNKNKHTEEL